MSLLIAVETGGILNVALGEVPVVDSETRSGGDSLEGRGGGGSRS